MTTSRRVGEKVGVKHLVLVEGFATFTGPILRTSGNSRLLDETTALLMSPTLGRQLSLLAVLASTVVAKLVLEHPKTQGTSRVPQMAGRAFAHLRNQPGVECRSPSSRKSRRELILW